MENENNFKECPYTGYSYTEKAKFKLCYESTDINQQGMVISSDLITLTPRLGQHHASLQKYKLKYVWEKGHGPYNLDRSITKWMH